MPTLGKPKTGALNRFRHVKIAKEAKSKKLSNRLNEISGAKNEKQFVDRATHNKLGKDGFLKLLSFQLQNQDPLKPMDQKKFASDLAQFSQLEQLTNMNNKMDSISGNKSTEDKFFGASFLGKEVVTMGTTIKYDGHSNRVRLPFVFDKSSKETMVRIYDSKNQMVAEINKGAMSKGSNSVFWDGISLDKTRAVKDTYRFEVKGWDDTFTEFKGKTMSSGIVVGVNFDKNGDTVLGINDGSQVYLRDVKSFRLPRETSLSPEKLSDLKEKALSGYNKMNKLN